MPLYQHTYDFDLDSEEVGIRIYSALSLVYVFWKKHNSGAAFRADLTTAFELARQRQLRYWLSDSRALNYAHAADQKWTSQAAKSLLAQSRLEKMAHVVPEDSFRTLIAFQMAEDLEQNNPVPGTRVEVFTEMEDALFWLNIS